MGFVAKVLLRAVGIAAIACLWFARGTEGSELWQSHDDPEVLRAITTQQVRAEECNGSKYARVCPAGWLMVFEQTMYGACSPVGCFHLHPSPDDTMAVQVSGKVHPSLANGGKQMDPAASFILVWPLSARTYLFHDTYVVSQHKSLTA